MPHRTSHSQNNNYKACPQYWNLYYVKKYRPETEGSSLYFGSAVDAAVTKMLKGEKDVDKIIRNFYDRWHTAFQNGKPKPVFDNPNIIFANADFDEHVLEDKDKTQLATWAKELKLRKKCSPAEAIKLLKDILKIKKNKYKSTNEKQLKYFNRASWLSMKRKGKLLIHAFHDQFLPKVKKVISTQQYGKITEPVSGDSIVGYIDMVLEIEGYDKPVIFDLKTSAWPYTQDQIDVTDQLTLYAAMKANDYNTDLVGYVVLCKNIPKDSVATCESCGFTKESTHRTCNNEIKGKRCGGKWDEKVTCKPQVQVLVESKSQEQIDDLMQDVSNLVLAQKNRIIYKNTDKCNNWYGNVCPYYDACHKKDYSKLKKA